MSRICKPIATESRLMVVRGLERGEWGVIANKHKVSFCGDENVLEFVLMVAQLHECIKNH